MTDKAHTIIDKPHLYDVVYIEWNINPYDYKESHLILYLQKDDISKNPDPEGQALFTPIRG